MQNRKQPRNSAHKVGPLRASDSGKESSRKKLIRQYEARLKVLEAERANHDAAWEKIQSEYQQRREAQRITVAHHEAGHAVIAFMLNMRFKYVTIKEDIKENSLGHLMPYKVKYFNKLHYTDPTPSEREKIERSLIMCCAGYFAEKQYTGKEDRSGAMGDWEMATKITMAFKKSTKQTEAYLNYISIAAEELVSMHWNFITQFAGELLKKETLSEKESAKFFSYVLNSNSHE